MLKVEAHARRQTQVGFNFIVETTRQAMKQRMMAGEFGRVRRVGFLGYWPRATGYFTRAAWAGRLLLDGRLVLDSCVGNAMAHFIHNLHFWCGQTELFSWEEVVAAEVELYRAHAIENFDTCFARGRCANDIEFHVAVTHAGDDAQYHREWIECERASITYITGQMCHIDWQDGRRETVETDQGDLIGNFRAYFRYLRGESPRPLTRLIDSRPFVHFNNLIYVAAKTITAVAEEHLRRTAHGGDEFVTINGIRDCMEEFGRSGLLPSEQGVPWCRPGGRATAGEISQLAAVVQEMARMHEP
jgi:predicted dehydrogenase